MVKLREVGFTEFLELVDYLESISEGGTQALIGRFFPFMSATEELELNYVIDTREQTRFEAFREAHPDMEVDPEGKTEPSKKDYWEVHLKSIEAVHEMASKYLEKRGGIEDLQNKPNTQITSARSLKPLLSMPRQDPAFYVPKRKLFLDKHPNGALSKQRVEDAEKRLRNLKIAPNSVMTAMFAFCSSKKPENYRVFVDHFLRRLEILSEDSELKSDVNRDFLAALKTLSETNK
jgi:hypothetical protein